MEETILYLAPIKEKLPRYLLQMSNTTGTTSFKSQPIKLSGWPGFGLRGARLRGEHHALLFPLEEKYLSLVTCSLHNQDDQEAGTTLEWTIHSIKL